MHAEVEGLSKQRQRRASGQNEHIELASSLLRQVFAEPFHVLLHVDVNVTDPWNQVLKSIGEIKSTVRARCAQPFP